MHFKWRLIVFLCAVIAIGAWHEIAEIPPNSGAKTVDALVTKLLGTLTATIFGYEQSLAAALLAGLLLVILLGSVIGKIFSILFFPSSIKHWLGKREEKKRIMSLFHKIKPALHLYEKSKQPEPEEPLDPDELEGIEELEDLDELKDKDEPEGTDKPEDPTTNPEEAGKGCLRLIAIAIIIVLCILILAYISL